MKHIRILLFSLFLTPVAAMAAGDDFKMAAQLLAAAKNADIAQVQSLVNAGADINFVDNTGLSIVCTALMNNDVRAAQILQMYGADASKCDQQIKKYKSKLPKTESGGLFSGLSSAQGIALTAAGAAVVVGGVVFLSDIFSAGNSNNSVSSTGGRDNGTDGGTDTSTSTAAFTIPYGPAMPRSEDETSNYATNLNLYSPSIAGTRKDIYTLMTNTYGQNYLLMMHGYSTLARGYMGMRTLRNTTGYVPITLSGNNLGTNAVLGDRPVNVALITKNGVNSASKPTSELSAEIGALDDVLLPWTTLNTNGTSANGASNDMVSSKYYNNKITRGTDNNSILDDSTSEDNALSSLFDLAGYGTVINNSFATDLDNLKAKIVGGSESGYASADYVGFMPNGQMTVFRTGGGTGLLTATTTLSGSLTDNGTTGFNTGDIINLYGFNLNVTLNSNGRDFSATDGTNTYSGYIGMDGLYYIDSTKDGKIDQGFTLATGNFTLTKESKTIDYLNYKALLTAGALWYSGDSVTGGRSKPDVIANAAVISELYDVDSKTVSDVLSVASASRATYFTSLVNSYYNKNTTDGIAGADALPGTDAASFFGGLGSSYSPIVIFSTGGFETDSSYSGQTLTASFENSAPLVFSNLDHLFMSVVAVGLNGVGTNGQGSVSGYAPAGKIVLSQWLDNNGTTSVTTDDKYYKSRACGIAGKGAGDVDPWCFAAAGLTDELAVSSMAGAVGSLKSAFSYMNNKQIFALLALTADGAYLGTTTSGTAITKTELIAYLKTLYTMPTEYQYRWETGGEDYLAVFKEVFGYGLINLERATKPAAKVYYYDGTNIVSTSGNGYWRTASTTTFRTNSVITPRAATVSADYYDVLTNVDNTLTLPRVFENEFAINSGNYGLYMGDVLGEFNTVKDNNTEFKQGNISFNMKISEKQYVDNLGGLDNLQFGYTSGNIEIRAGYQRHFTDGANRFDATANPILGLASNAISNDVNYKFGKIGFGVRTFSGNITDENLLENDPTVTSQFMPAKLGTIQGGESSVSIGFDNLSLTTAVGFAHESNTLLGAQTDGLLGLGNGNTTYIDSVVKFDAANDISLFARSSFADTKSNPQGSLIMGLSDIQSNAFSVGADIGKFSIAVAQPLSVTNGRMKYAYADFDVIENGEDFDLTTNTYLADISLVPEKRETRFSGSYREKLGAFTDGAVGFIYRVNPNNTDEFGNESIFMLKVSHKLGI